MNVWQIAAGDGSRDYSEVFLKFGVILVGPGNYGDYFENKQTYNQPNFPSFIPVFSEIIKEDDLIVLKKPYGRQWEILAVGRICSKYLHEEVFSDVDGWDLQHCRKVEWKIPTSQTIVGGLRRGTLSGVNKRDLRNLASKIWNNGQVNGEFSPNLPTPQEEIELDRLIDSLMILGLSANSAELITNTIWKLKRLAKWYNSHGSSVGEHEIRTFLIAPFITALGWAEQKIKIEWNKIDMVIFDQPYSSDAKPKIIIETKRLWDGLLYGPEQARTYAKNYKTCKYLIVTDGIRYKLFELQEKKWNYSAYMNMLSLKERHPYFEHVNGALDFFKRVMPE